MEDIITNLYYGKIKGINSSDGMYNLLVTLPDKTDINVKTEATNTDLVVNTIYKMKVGRHSNSDRNVFYLLEYSRVSNLDNVEEMDMAYRLFDKNCPFTAKELEKKIYSYVGKIENPVILDITKHLLKKYFKDFFIYPAAARFHHAYVGGLAYHTLGMLDLADGFLNNYPFLDKNYLYAGIILHDIGKVKEFTGVENTEYALEGQLLGHLVIGGLELDKIATELGYQGKEEVLLLEHMIISHHGQQIFGACKKPQTPEALLLWYIDTLDSKFRVLGEELAKTEPGTFTDSIGVLEKGRFYRTK